MRKSDVVCPKCNAGYRRIELATRPGTQGEFRCRICGHVLELFDGSSEVALRLTVPPAKYSDRKNGFQADAWRPVTRQDGSKP